MADYANVEPFTQLNRAKQRVSRYELPISLPARTALNALLDTVGTYLESDAAMPDEGELSPEVQHMRSVFVEALELLGNPLGRPSTWT